MKDRGNAFVEIKLTRRNSQTAVTAKVYITSDNINQKLMRRNTKELEFAFAENLGNSTRFIPLYQVENESYSVYLPLR